MDRKAYFASYYQQHRKPQPPSWRLCAVCGKATKGTLRKLYCSPACRQKAYRRR